MLSAVQGFANRHRKGLVITAGLTGGIYMMGKYAKSKLFEFHEKSASERTAKENMKRRFEQNQQDCVFTVLSLLPTLGDQLLHELNVELITSKLHQTRSQRSTPAPTPDSSMILPPKSTSMEQDEDSKQEDTKTEAAEEQQQEGFSENKEGESEKTTDDQAAAAALTEGHDTKEDSADSTATSDTNGDDSNQSSQPSSTVSETDKDEKPATAQEEEAKSESQEAPAAAAATVAVVEPQPIVKDEATVAIERKTKLELWNELKLMSFTRTVTALYSLTFLTLLTQVQLNLLGRFTYVSSVIALSNTTDESYRVDSPAVKGSLSSTAGQLDFQTEKKYLTFSYWLLHEGWRRWSERVREVVEDVVGGISLKKTFTAKDFSDLLVEIRSRLEYTEDKEGDRIPVNMREYMLPDEASDEREVLRAGGVDEFDLVVDPTLRNLLDETRDFIDSADFTTVLSSTLATTFARFNLALQPTFNPFLLSPPQTNSSSAVIAEIEDDEDIDRAVPLASLLPVIARQAHLIINGVPNEYVESLAMVKELQAFSAIVYSSFSEQLVNN
ncbi:MAG: Peroxin-3 [Linnemannia gamsii]|nr:MAG: Peroxin-3 [Linnemannia gamsii]